MKNKPFLFIIILLIAAIIVSGCDTSGIIPPIQEDVEVPELTPEEIDLIKKYGFGGDYVVRWPDGPVDVYDTTGYSQMQTVLNQWNAVMGGKVILRLSNNPNSQVKIIFDENLGEEELCGNANCEIEDYSFSKIIIKINPECLSYAYPLYLCYFNAVAGFNTCVEVSPLPFETWSEFYEIPNMIKKMVRALHKVPPGYYLNQEQEIEFEPINSVIYPSECYGCWEGASEFGGFNVIDYDESSKVTLRQKEGNLPKSIRVVLEGVKFDIQKPYIYSGTSIDYCTTKLMTGDWASSSSTIAEATFIDGKPANDNNVYETINGYVIEVDFLLSQIYLKLSENPKNAFQGVPWKRIKMKVYNLSGNEIGSYTFNAGILPKVKSYFGQCVWWAIKQKWETDGGPIPSSFYPPSGGLAIDQNHFPETGFNDILVAYYDEVEHYAFIEDVNGEIVTISQFNYPKQERKSVQKLRWNDEIWSVPDIGNCKYYFQFNYYIR